MSALDTELNTKYRECVQKLYSIAPSFQRVGAAGYHPGLDTMKDFSEFLGAPDKSLITVHIAGTNGKGSVAHMLASALAAAHPGTKVGLYTSPHLLDFRERIRTVSTLRNADGRFYSEIGKEDVVDFLDRAASFIDERTPSFFEITTAMAFDYFHRTGTDIAVVETGLGGRLDSTNIIVPKLSVITSIGLDHKDILGDTIEKIAAEKAGIIKSGVPVVAGKMPQEALSVIESVAAGMGSPLFHAGELTEDGVRAEQVASEADLHSDCQVKNVATVLTALRVLGEDAVRKGSRVYEALIHAAELTGLRGRWERLSARPEVLCDIGHNVEAVSVSMRQLVKDAGGRHIIMVFGMASDKDMEAVCRLLPEGPEYIFTQAKGSRAMSAAGLKAIAEHAGCRNSAVIPDVAEAVTAALGRAAADDVVFIGGSSYVVAEALEFWEENLHNKNVNE